MDLEKLGVDFHIDLTRLQDEWSNQPQMVYNTNAHTAELERAHNKAEVEFEKVKARVGADIRRNPAKYDVGKITEGSVDEARVQVDEYQEALGRVHDALLALNKARAVSKALEHRKKALEKIVELWLRSYFSEPRAPETSDKTYDKAEVRSRGRRRASAGDFSDD